MRRVFIDTSGFDAFLDGSDPFHTQARDLFLRAEAEGWNLITSSFVVHECWSLLQARLGWDAVEDWLRGLLARCEVVWVAPDAYERATSRCRQARERRLSLTDCVSFEVMNQAGCRECIADDEDFDRQGFTRPA